MPYLDGTTIELVRGDAPRGRARVAVFDFDGTLSLVRAGWQGVMVTLMVEHLRQTPRREADNVLRAVATEIVEGLTGAPTLEQMRQLAVEVDRRGGRALEPQAYKQAYLERLGECVADRLARLQSGQLAPEALLVPGGRAVLDGLWARGVICYLASGTDEPSVQAEAEALGLSGYFAGIFGARDGDPSAAKPAVIDALAREHELSGAELISFGDGDVEIAHTRGLGALAVGVAFDESGRGGLDEAKRARLIRAGADLIIADYGEAAALLNYLFTESD